MKYVGKCSEWEAPERIALAVWSVPGQVYLPSYEQNQGILFTLTHATVAGGASVPASRLVSSLAPPNLFPQRLARRPMI